MEILYKLILAGHIISGMTALVAGIVAIISSKGKNVHRKSGKTFYYSMLIVCASAIFISVVKNNTFLLHIGIFSFFLVFTGYRSIKNKGLKPNILDWVILCISVINCGIMIFSLNIVLMVFGGIGAWLSIADFRLFVLAIHEKSIPKNQWLIRHIGMMLGGYISTSTAFIVVNVTMTDFPFIPWLLPSAVGTPLIIYWSRKYSLKKKPIS